MGNFVKQFVRDEEAADLIEYALVVGLVSLAAAATLGTFSTGLNNLYTRIKGDLDAILP